MGHTILRTTPRYIANNSGYHRQILEELAERFGDVTVWTMQKGLLLFHKKLLVIIMTFTTIFLGACSFLCRGIYILELYKRGI